VFPLCLGGNVFGWTLDEERSFAVLDAYREAGGNFIDTADIYGRRGAEGIGSSERILGRWIASRGNRDELVIATKVGMAEDPHGLSAKTLATGAEASLQRLGIDRIDLYYAHQEDPDTPLEETLAAFATLIAEGKIAHAAASNYTPERLEQALDLAEQQAGLAPYVALQPHYNLMERPGYEGPLMDLCERRGLACLPYFSLARGFLTGKYRPGGEDIDSPAPAAYVTSTSTTAASRCSTRSTRSPPRTRSAWRPSRSPGSPRNRPCSRRSPAPPPPSSSPTCCSR
jgi:aryl-alcohol dehydrogenase-like predicted oxidoreductase